MLFNCQCGTQIHLNTQLHPDKNILNLMCLPCFKEIKPDVYIISYYTEGENCLKEIKIIANTKDEAIEILKLHNNEQFVIKEVIFFAVQPHFKGE